MDSSSFSKSGMIEDRRKTTMMPMRIHEMDLGQPKSAGQPAKTQRSQPIRVKPLLEEMERSRSKTNVSGKMMPMRIHKMDPGLPKSAGKTQRSQPIRVGPLLEAMERSSSKPNAFARRTTVCPAVTGNVRRQLYNEAADQILPDTSTIAGSHSNTGKQSQPVRLGLSKSDGKVKLNDQRSQPVSDKLPMESWEESQTVRREGQKSVMGRLRSVNVRRKLYSIVPSPGASHKAGKKSMAPNKPQEEANTSLKTERVVKAGAEVIRNTVVVSKAPRRSFLLPPNSIRDKHINVKAKDTIIEETTTSLSPQERNITNHSKTTEEIKVAIAPDVHKIATLPEVESLPHVLLSVESVVTNSSQGSEQVFGSNIELPRPSVIMNLATSTASKPRNQSISSERSSKSDFALSSPPPQELNKNSTMPLHRLDAVNTSLQDLFGNSQQHSIIPPRNSILPCNSFLRNCGSGDQAIVEMDRQTLMWLYGNVKLSIQSTEENLFSMKMILKSLEDIINSSEPEEKPLKTDTNDVINSSEAVEKPLKTGTNDIINTFESVEKPLKIGTNYVPVKVPTTVIDNCEVMEEELGGNHLLSISVAHENEIVEDTQESYEEDFAAENKENLSTINSQEEETEQEKTVEKPRRRSARLAALENRSLENLDGSFSTIEKQLNITHDKSKRGTPDKFTPAKRKTVDPRSRRSIREYMALKSCAKVLQTPDHKGFPALNCDNTGTPAQRRAAERALSLRVLNQLHNLYDESPQ